MPYEMPIKGPVSGRYDESDSGRVLRRRQADAAAALDRLPPPAAPAAGRFVGQTFSGGAYPTTVPAYYLTHPVDVGGAETEGAAASTAASSGTKAVWVLGPVVPVLGSFLLARLIDGRWAAGFSAPYGGGGGVTIPGCPCSSSPITLNMVSSAPASNNHILQSATLVYGSTPSALAALGIGQSAYLSTTTFTDFSTGDQFWYFLSCYLGYYILSRVYATSLYGSPYHDMIRYRWPISAAPNTCVPFSLTNGQIFSGGDPTCVVTITGTSPYG